MLRYTSQILILVLTSVFLQAKQDQKMIRILCFGDSITHKGQWHQIVSQDPEFETINAGRSGRRIAQGVKELPQYLKKHHKVDKLIILLGVNDLPARDPRPGKEKDRAEKTAAPFRRFSRGRRAARKARGKAARGENAWPRSLKARHCLNRPLLKKLNPPV